MRESDRLENSSLSLFSSLLCCVLLSNHLSLVIGIDLRYELIKCWGENIIFNEIKIICVCLDRSGFTINKENCTSSVRNIVGVSRLSFSCNLTSRVFRTKNVIFSYIGQQQPQISRGCHMLVLGPISADRYDISPVNFHHHYVPII